MCRAEQRASGAPGKVVQAAWVVAWAAVVVRAAWERAEVGCRAHMAGEHTPERMDEAGIHARLICILNLPNHAPPLQQRSPTAHAALPMPTAAGGLRPWLSPGTCGSRAAAAGRQQGAPEAAGHAVRDALAVRLLRLAHLV